MKTNKQTNKRKKSITNIGNDKIKFKKIYKIK